MMRTEMPPSNRLFVSSFRYAALAVAGLMSSLSFVSPAATASAMSVSSFTGTSTGSSCAVVGVGVLGTSLCQQILSSREFADTVVTGITKTDKRHDQIREQVGYGPDRFLLTTMEQQSAGGGASRFKNVVFCAPPSGFDDYPAAVQQAIDDLWVGPQGGGVFVFTSSGAVYGPSNKNTVTETSPTADEKDINPRIGRLLNAERNCLNAGGCCIRLSGLYNLKRGAHNFWLTSGKEITGRPDGIINLVHYVDAARSCHAALKAGPEICSGKVFLISDGHPVTREEICASALKAKEYQGYGMPRFASTTTPPPPSARGFGDLGKIYDGSATNEMLQWSPSYVSFDSFMESHA